MKKLSVISMILAACLLFGIEYRVVQVVGRVKIINGKKVMIAKKGMVLNEKALIKTFSGSKIKIKLANGKVRVIPANKNVAVTSLDGNRSKVSTMYLNAMKLSKRTISYRKTTAVAGVRGAEQGQVTFQPKFAGGDDNNVSADVELNQAQAALKNGDFKTAIGKLESYIRNAKDDAKKALAYDLLTAGHMELLQYDNALRTAKTGIELNPHKDIEASLNYKITLCYFFQENDQKAIDVVDKKLSSNISSQFYWNALSIKYFCLIRLDEKKDAKKLKKDIQLNCPDEEVKESVNSI